MPKKSKKSKRKPQSTEETTMSLGMNSPSPITDDPSLGSDPTPEDPFEDPAPEPSRDVDLESKYDHHPDQLYVSEVVRKFIPSTHAVLDKHYEVFDEEDKRRPEIYLENFIYGGYLKPYGGEGGFPWTVVEPESIEDLKGNLQNKRRQVFSTSTAANTTSWLKVSFESPIAPGVTTSLMSLKCYVDLGERKGSGTQGRSYLTDYVSVGFPNDVIGPMMEEIANGVGCAGVEIGGGAKQLKQEGCIWTNCNLTKPGRKNTEDNVIYVMKPRSKKKQQLSRLVVQGNEGRIKECIIFFTAGLSKTNDTGRRMRLSDLPTSQMRLTMSITQFVYIGDAPPNIIGTSRLYNSGGSRNKYSIRFS